MKSRMEELYNSQLKKELQQELGLKNIMQVPRISKIVVNIGAKDAVGDNKVLTAIKATLDLIAGQSSVKTKARKSIASFKLREGMAIGTMVTLRGDRMYHFLDKLINVALPSVRDFQGVPTKLDGCGNYNLGIKDWMVFPEVDYDKVGRSRGMNITIQTSTASDEHGRALLEKFKMPFQKKR